MKIFLLLIIQIIGVSHAFAADMSRKWQGICNFNGEEDSQEIEIKNDLSSISIDGNLFSLNTTTTRNHSGVESGQEWKEVTVYDWQWNEDKLP